MNNCAFVDPSYEDFLMHYGRLGQKKGVRNYENYDGTLTPAGKERYSVYWKSGRNLRGKKVDYGPDSTNRKRLRRPNVAGRGPASVRPDRAQGSYQSQYEKADGSLTAEGKKKFGDVLTREEMARLVRNYNNTNGTNYKVGEVSFKKNGKLYSTEGERVNEKVELSKNDPIAAQTKPGMFGRDKELSYKEKLQNVRNMSNEDLQRGIERAKLEKAYIAELGIQKSRGEKFLDSLKDNARVASGEVAKVAMQEAGTAFLNKFLVPKLQKMGVSPEEAKKAAETIGEAASKAQNAIKQEVKQQQTVQNNTTKNDNNTNNNNTAKLTKPVEQTSSNDLKSFIKSTRKDIPADKVDKMGRNDLEQIARKQLGSSNGGNNASTQTNETKPAPPSTSGNSAKGERFSGVAPRTANSYSPTHNSRPVEYWTREQLKNEIITKGSKKDAEGIDSWTTDKLIDRVKWLQQFDD